MIYGRKKNGRFKRKPSRVWAFTRSCARFVCYVGLATVSVILGLTLLAILGVIVLTVLTYFGG